MLKKAFITAPILRISDNKNLFRLFTNVSDFATSMVLSQLDPVDGLFHPVAFYLKSLNVYKQNYKIYNKKLLAIFQAFEEYKHYLKEYLLPFKIWSNYLNLTYFRAAQKLTRQ